LIEQHGKFRLKDLLKQLSQGKDINAALLAVYNMDLSQLEKQWRLYESR